MTGLSWVYDRNEEVDIATCATFRLIHAMTYINMLWRAKIIPILGKDWLSVFQGFPRLQTQAPINEECRNL